MSGKELQVDEVKELAGAAAESPRPALERLRRWVIWQIEWLDDFFGHPFRGAFCNRITMSKWWGTPDFKCAVCGFESHLGPRHSEYIVDPCPGCESRMTSAEWRQELHETITAPERETETQ